MSICAVDDDNLLCSRREGELRVSYVAGKMQSFAEMADKRLCIDLANTQQCSVEASLLVLTKIFNWKLVL